jgi:hypothetical protein
MLISSRRHISDYSSAAADVRLQIATTRAVGHPEDPVTAVERQGIDRIRDLIILGSRFGHDSNGSLDVASSTSEQIDLVEELEALIPGRAQSVTGEDGTLDLRRWSELACAILDLFKQEARWDDLSPKQREFVEVEFEPFLVELLNVSPEDEEE